MPDGIKRLQNELVSIYQANKDCGATFEDSEIIAAYEAAIEALEKQIPKKIIPANEEELAEEGWYMCPVCHSLEYYSYKSEYCDVCGQALDWSEVE